MFAKVSSIALIGMEARPVEVEVALDRHLPDFQIVGLPSAGVRESRQRVRAAVVNSKQAWPNQRITANLAPGDLRKEGSLLDLPLAMGVLAASGRLPAAALRPFLFLGELALDGALRPVRGAIAAALSVGEALEAPDVWSVAGLLAGGEPVGTARPFRAPHHHASAAAVIGGGSPMPRPGAVSLAHHGVLFLDEAPLFSRAVLDGLRQPVEDGFVTIARRGATVRFPARSSLVAAANPCLCSRRSQHAGVCSCSVGRLEAYRGRLSGPLLDRIDLQVEVAALSEDELLQMEPS